MQENAEVPLQDIALTLYSGNGIFQAGSFEGPQTAGQTAGTYSLRRSAAGPEEELYILITDAMASNFPETLDGIFGIYLDIRQFAYPLSNDSKDAIYKVYSRAVNDDPDMFYFVPDIYFHDDTENDLIMGLFMAVNQSVYQNTDTYKSEKQALLQDAFPDGYSDFQPLEIALTLHDYLALHVSYDHAAAELGYSGNEAYLRYPDSFSAYGAIVGKKAVCHGLSLAYKTLLAECGIDSYLVPDYGRGHVWNLINLDGNWYHADITNAIGPRNKSPNQVLHGRFLLSDQEQDQYYAQSGWSAGGLPPAEQPHPLSSFWRDVNSGMFLVDGNWYYTSDSGSLMKRAMSSSSGAARLYDTISCPVRIHNKLYFGDSAGGIYAFSPSAGIRTPRGSFPEGLSALTAGAALFEGNVLPYQTLGFSRSNGSVWQCYEGADLGDANGDGSVNVIDVLYLLQQISANPQLTALDMPKAELIYDQYINDDDVSRIAELIAQLAV